MTDKTSPFIYSRLHDTMSIYTDNYMEIEEDWLSVLTISTQYYKPPSRKILIKPYDLYKFFIYGEGLISIIQSYVKDTNGNYVAQRNDKPPLASYEVNNPINRISLLDLVRRIQTSLDLNVLRTLLSHPVGRYYIFSDSSDNFYGSSYSTKSKTYVGHNIDGNILTGIKMDLSSNKSSLRPHFLNEDQWEFDKMFQYNLKLVQDNSVN